ncbi:MAG: SUMF1/EgtB/PvdO family nonheme iron enzyme [Bacteroidota bacterium]
MTDSTFSTLTKTLNYVRELVKSDQLREALAGFEHTQYEFDSIGLIRSLNQLEREKRLGEVEDRMYKIQKANLSSHILQLVERMERESREEYLWSRASQTQTLKPHLEYLKEFPGGQYAEEAFWSVARIENSQQSLENYLQQFPQGKYWEEAIKAIEGRAALENLPIPTPNVGRKSYFAFDMYMVGGIFLIGSFLFLLMRYVLFPDFFEDKRRNQQFISLRIDSQMVKIGGGSYPYDWGEQKPLTIQLSPFEIAKYEVTQAQWKELMGMNPSHHKNCPDCPVESVSWYEALEFCNRLSVRQGIEPYYVLDSLSQDPDNKDLSDFQKWQVDINPLSIGYRLPTEAEWDYVYRIGKLGEEGMPQPEPKSKNWVSMFGPRTEPVSRVKSNTIGILGMDENVLEWCWDWYLSQRYSGFLDRGLPLRDPQGPSSGRFRLVKGGDYEKGLVAANGQNRADVSSIAKSRNLGLRLARSLAPVVQMVPLSTATYYMGNEGWGSRKNERPLHEVSIEAFEIAPYEVTQQMWVQVMELDSVPSCQDCPASNLTWYQAINFCNRLSMRHGFRPAYIIDSTQNQEQPNPTTTGAPSVYRDSTADGYRLPTEAEWEYAARGGGRSRGYTFSGGNELDSLGWFKANTEAHLSHLEMSPVMVGKKQGNELQLFDMSGNVWEWCEDIYSLYPGNGDKGKGDIIPLSSSPRVLRGGAFSSGAYYCRIPTRLGRAPQKADVSWGFRLARSIMQ